MDAENLLETAEKGEKPFPGMPPEEIPVESGLHPKNGIAVPPFENRLPC
jgi:hypothetical protein